MAEADKASKRLRGQEGWQPWVENSDVLPGACRTTCTLPVCGDGVVDPTEACDDGPDNSDRAPGACRTTCALGSRGDGVLDPGELCDDGADNSSTEADACRRTCVTASCGDGVVDTNEACDQGANNSNLRADACRTGCVQASCGDDVIDSGETCDDGERNSDLAPDACRTTCLAAACGDGVIDTDEACDEGALNSDTMADGCRTTCRRAFCGDGVVDTGEACDRALANSDVVADACRTTCVEASCGDGVTDSGETCDDGAFNSDTVADRCRPGCVAPSCGDGVVDSGEACDEGADNSDTLVDACRTTCAAAGCGDGVQDTGEACDDGAMNSDTVADACRASCTEAACGDGVIDTNEACDNGAMNSDVVANACRTSCIEAGCGDGVVDIGESCDDGASNSDTQPGACRTTCSRPACGDSVVDAMAGEECDDGNVVSGDGCDASCLDEDECMTATSTCTVGYRCVNTVPGFRCDCAANAFLVAGAPSRCFSYPLPAERLSSPPATIGHVDGDRFPDLLFISGSSNIVSPAYGDGTGQFATRTGAPFARPPSTSLAFEARLLQLDANATTDWLILGTGQLHVFANASAPLINLSPTQPAIVAIGDLDADRLDEYIISTSNSLEVREDRARLKQSIAVTAKIFNGALGDLDGDGDRDLVVILGGTLFTLSNGGGPNYAFGPLNLIFGSSASNLALGDVDGDGDLDIIVDRGEGYYANSGSGTFGAELATPWMDTGRVTVRDLTGDNLSDVAFTDRFNLTVLPRTSTASRFAAPVRYYKGSFSLRDYFADVNDDGRLDVLTIIDRPSGGQSLLTGFGQGDRFSLPRLTVVGSQQLYGAALGDVDDDGDNDVIVHPRGRSASLLTNDGRGDFSVGALSGLASNPERIFIDDFDGDGRTDLLYDRPFDAVTLYAGAAQGGFATGRSSIGIETVCGLGEFDADTDIDLIACSPTAVQVYHAQNLSFSAGQTLSNARLPAAVGRVDTDPVVDVVANVGGPAFGLFTGTSSGAFTFQFSYVPSRTVDFLTIADLDGDGRGDFVARNSTAIFWARNLGTAFTSETVVSLCASTAIMDVKVADINSDRRPDLVALCGTDLRIILNLPTGFEIVDIRPMYPNDFVVAPFDGDGRPDFVFIGGQTRLSTTTGLVWFAGTN